VLIEGKRIIIQQVLSVMKIETKNPKNSKWGRIPEHYSNMEV
jgi:hypothetical protein